MSNSFTISPTSFTASVGQDYPASGFYQVNTVGDVTGYELFSETPPDLVFDTTTGELSGTPTQTGTFGVTISATFNSGSPNPIIRTFTLNVENNDFSINPIQLEATVNTNYDSFYVGSTTGDVINYAIDPTPPAGLNFNTTTGIFSGSSSTLREPVNYRISANFYTTTGAPPDIPVGFELSFTCFLKGSKILTANGYEKIENLKKGDLIETYQHGLKEIKLIGKSEIYHSANKERIKDQLYKYEKEDLVITGGHSVLVDELKEEEEILNKKYFGGVVPKIDNLYRLLACVDENASIYEKEGKYFIYHLALESEDEDQAYGIYANGMLVESCAIKYLKEVSGMELL